jgi:hypothetical protein
LTRFKDLDGMPKVTMSTPLEFFKRVQATAEDIPVWVGELVSNEISLFRSHFGLKSKLLTKR